MRVFNVPTGGVLSLAYSPCGRYVYSSDNGRWYTRWDLESGGRVKLFQRAETVTNHFPRIAVSADGKYLMDNTNPPGVWDLKKGGIFEKCPNEIGFAGAHMDPEGKKILSLKNDWTGIRWWEFGDPDVVTGEETEWAVNGTIKTFHTRGDQVAILNWSDEVTVHAWGVGAGKERLLTVTHDVKQIQKAVLTPEFDRIGLITADAVCFYELRDEQQTPVTVQCERAYWRSAFHPSEPIMACVAKRGDKNVLALMNYVTGGEVRAVDFDLGQDISCVAFSPDGMTCAAGGTNKKFVVFDLDL